MDLREAAEFLGNFEVLRRLPRGLALFFELLLAFFFFLEEGEPAALALDFFFLMFVFCATFLPFTPVSFFFFFPSLKKQQ